MILKFQLQGGRFLINLFQLRKGEFMLKFIKNKKGVAEVIGTIMAILILLFFFANVYLFNDVATKQMDSMYNQKMNSLITVSLSPDNSSLIVTNTGGEDTALTMLWLDSGSGPNQIHANYALSSTLYVVPVRT